MAFSCKQTFLLTLSVSLKCVLDVKKIWWINSLAPKTLAKQISQNLFCLYSYLLPCSFCLHCLFFDKLPPRWSLKYGETLAWDLYCIKVYACVWGYNSDNGFWHWKPNINWKRKYLHWNICIWKKEKRRGLRLARF